MVESGAWTDLLDPAADEVRAVVPAIRRLAVEALTERRRPERLPRPTLESHGSYVLGILLLPIVVREEDRVFYQEIDVVLTGDRVLTVRRTPPGGEPPFDEHELRAACETADREPGVVLSRVVDLLGERYLDLVDDLDAEVEELEDGIETWRAERVRRRLSELRHAMLEVRQTLAPTRDAVRRIVDGRLQIDDEDAFDRDLRLDFGDSYDKLLRANEGLDVSRELLSSARDFHQAMIAEGQNDVVKKLTVIASLLLLPTLIVGVYGQNFRHMPELHWRLGYAFSWSLIVASTVVQLVFFRWRRWI